MELIARLGIAISVEEIHAAAAQVARFDGDGSGERALHIEVPLLHVRAGDPLPVATARPKPQVRCSPAAASNRELETVREWVAEVGGRCAETVIGEDRGRTPGKAAAHERCPSRR